MSELSSAPKTTIRMTGGSFCAFIGDTCYEKGDGGACATRCRYRTGSLAVAEQTARDPSVIIPNTLAGLALAVEVVVPDSDVPVAAFS